MFKRYLQLVEAVLLVDVAGLQRAFRISRSCAVAAIPFPSIPLSSQISVPLLPKIVQASRIWASFLVF